MGIMWHNDRFRIPFIVDKWSICFLQGVSWRFKVNNQDSDNEPQSMNKWPWNEGLLLPRIKITGYLVLNIDLFFGYFLENLWSLLGWLMRMVKKYVSPDERENTLIGRKIFWGLFDHCKVDNRVSWNTLVFTFNSSSPFDHKYEFSRKSRPITLLENFWKSISQERHIRFLIWSAYGLYFDSLWRENNVFNKIWSIRQSLLRYFSKNAKIFINFIRISKLVLNYKYWIIQVSDPDSAGINNRWMRKLQLYFF